MWPVPESHQQHQIYLPTSGYGKSGIEYGQCLTHTFCSNRPANRRVLTSSLRKACDWLTLLANKPPLCRAVRLDYMSGLRPDSDKRVPASISTSTSACQRQRQHRRVNVNDNIGVSTSTTASARIASRINPLSGLAEKFAETGLLVSSKMGSMDWPGLAWPDPVWFGTWSVSCLMPGLPGYGLPGAWPVELGMHVLVWFGPVWFGRV